MQRQNSSQRSRLVHQFSSIGTLPVLTAQKGHSPSRDNLLQTLIIRLERSIEIQNERLKTIEHCLKDMVTDRFDKLLEVNVSIKENTAKMVERRRERTAVPTARRIAKEMVSESEFTSEVRNNLMSLTHRNDGNFKSVKHRTVEPSPQKFQIIPQHKIQQQVAIQPQQPKNPLDLLALALQPPQPQPSTQQPKNKSPLELLATNLIQKATLLKQPPGIDQMIKRLGNIVIETTQRKYKQYVAKQIDTKELKAQFAWQLMEFSYNSTKKFQEQPEMFVYAVNHERKMELLQETDSTLKNILEFMIKKYPPSKTKVLDTELAKIIQEKKNHTKLKYDILLNSGMSFTDDTGKSDYTKEIKIWINRLINETKKVFPTFQNKVKEIFNGDQNSIDGESQIDYAIGSKISETVETYSEAELTQPGLKLKSPEILRILIKWTEQLAAVFLNSTEKILENRVGFKSSFKLSITLTQKRKQQLVDNIKKIYTDFITPTGKVNRESLFAFFNAVFVYVTGPIIGYRDLPEKDIVICKVSQYLNQLFEASTLKKLSVFLTGLNQIRKCYSQDLLQSNLDLITFGVLDLVRCKCMGNKKQIKSIYDRLLASDYLQVIRVKNKLNQSTRDILINFKIRDSFMIGQMQLALGDSQDDVNDHFCHYLYELQRSAFPVLMQAANMIVYNDNRIGYFDKKHDVRFKQNKMLGDDFKDTIFYKDGKMHCQFGHKQKVMIYKKNDVPFCCQYCANFIEAFKYSLEALYCPECYNTLCPRCILQSIPQIKYEYIHRYVKDSQKFASFIPKQQHIEFMGFANVKNLADKINKALDKTPYIILMQFDNQTPQPRQFIYKRIKGRVTQCFQSLLPATQPTSSDDTWNALMTTTQTELIRRSDIKLCQKWTMFSTPYYSLEPLLDDAGIKEIIGVYDSTRKQVLMIDIPETEQEIEERFEKKEIRKQVESENRKHEGNVELTGKRLENWEFLDKMRDEKLVTLNLWGNKIKSISYLKRFKNLRELHMRENEIQSIDELTDIPQVIHANFQNNKITKLPIVKLQKLQSLNLAFNQLNDISNLAHFQAKSLRFLIFNNNKIPEVPVINLPELMFIIFNNNLITKISDLSKSCLPKLDAFRAENNKIRGKLSKLNLPSLTQLQLGKNQIESIDEAFTEDGLSSIQTIGLSNNKITKLPVIKLSHITKISLKNNKIDQIQNLKDWSTPCLTQLDLSNNSITTSLPTFPSLPSLTTLHLSCNQIPSISALPSTQLPSLSTLTLNNNNLTQLPPIPFPNLKHLDMSHNKLSSASSLQHFKTYKLQYLNLNSNKITSEIPILQMPNLTQLLIEDNDVGELVCLTEKQLVPLLIKVEVKGNCKLEKGICMEKWKADNQREMREYCVKVGKKYEDVVNTNQ